MAKKKAASAMDEFMDFVRKQGVVGLAVGLAIGAQTTNTVNNIVSGFIDPLVTWILRWFSEDLENLANASYTFGESSDNPLTIGWGLILSAIIRLLAVIAVVYYIVRWLKLDKLDKEDKK
jgi:large conductance mechanosensitive channel